MLKVIVSLVFLILTQASALETVTGWSGFISVNDPKVPKAIAAAADSIFQIVYPHGKPEIKNVLDLDLKILAPSLPEEAWFKLVQMKVCQLQKIENCPIMPSTFTGTAFLVRDKKTIATNLHNIQSWLHYAKKFNPELEIANLQVPLILLDKEQNIVFFPKDEGTTLKLSFYNKSPTIFEEDYPWEASDRSVVFRVSDYVELYASVPFNFTPLKIGKFGNKGEPLFLGGFPNTQSGFKVSTGHVDAGSSFEHVNLLTNIAAAPGSSGGPVMRKNGEVVGILFAGDSSGSQLLQVNFPLMEKAWAELVSVGALSE